jgi:hypothetical protein
MWKAGSSKEDSRMTEESANEAREGRPASGWIRHSKKIKRQVIEARRAGMTLEETCERYGVSKSSASRWLVAAGKKRQAKAEPEKRVKFSQVTVREAQPPAGAAEATGFRLKLGPGCEIVGLSTRDVTEIVRGLGGATC